jgi:hypothetical protein
VVQSCLNNATRLNLGASERVTNARRDDSFSASGMQERATLSQRITPSFANKLSPNWGSRSPSAAMRRRALPKTIRSPNELVDIIARRIAAPAARERLIDRLLRAVQVDAERTRPSLSPRQDTPPYRTSPLAVITQKGYRQYQRRTGCICPGANARTPSLGGVRPAYCASSSRANFCTSTEMKMRWYTRSQYVMPKNREPTA